MANELNLQKFIVSIVVVGITLVLGIYINSTLGENLNDPNFAVTVINESFASNITTVPQTVAGASTLDFSNFAVTQLLIRNATGAGTWKVVPVLNYTVNATGTVALKAGIPAEYNNTVSRVSYTYTFTNQTAASTAANNVTNALATGTSWISILVVVGFATIILTMLTAGLGNAAREQGGVPYY